MAAEETRVTDDAQAELIDGQVAALSARTQEQFIAETLNWCAEHFRSNRARFVRPSDTGGWIVYTRQKGSLSTHTADYAEVAMAQTVGLGRQPLLVSRPRLTRIGATDLRPISVSSYLGIPVIAQDRLIGVIECSGDARPDIDAALQTALPHLARAGARLLFDPSLLPRPAIDADTILVLSSALWTTTPIALNPTDLTLLSSIDGPTTLSDAAILAGLDPQDSIPAAQALIESGLLAIHPNH